MRIQYKPKRIFMEIAIKEAEKSKKNKEWLFGAVIINNNKIIAKSDNNPNGHSEIAIMRKAGKKLRSKYLTDCILYTAHEPCRMCSGAAVLANMKGIVFGANVRELEEHFNKSGYKNKFFISAKEIIKKKYPKDIFLFKNFMRRECKELFNMY